ncbi:MAG: hypothetical protein SFV22_19920 [Saprospiraceae bacterium]|nr:hypothetical protein [Saprospiraceae bacterium]
MKKFLFLFFLAPLFLHAQALVYQLGGVNFEGCETLIQHNGQDIVALRLAPDGAFLLNADVFNEGGKLVATVRDNETTGRVILRQEKGGLRLYDASTNRLIYGFAGNAAADVSNVHINVTLDAYLPNGKKLIATPAESAYPTLADKKGMTIKNSKVAVTIN